MAEQLLTLDQFKDKNYGNVGSEKRNILDAGYENFKIGEMLQYARIE